MRSIIKVLLQPLQTQIGSSEQPKEDSNPMNHTKMAPFTTQKLLMFADILACIRHIFRCHPNMKNSFRECGGFKLVIDTIKSIERTGNPDVDELSFNYMLELLETFGIALRNTKANQEYMESLRYSSLTAALNESTFAFEASHLVHIRFLLCTRRFINKSTFIS